MKFNTTVVSALLQKAFPEAKIELETYTKSQWLNIHIDSRLFTSEIDDTNEIGFTEVSPLGGFGGHDAVIVAQSNLEAAEALISKLQSLRLSAADARQDDVDAQQNDADAQQIEARVSAKVMHASY